MGEKYGGRGFGGKSAVAKQKAKVLVPLCVLLVLFVWNSPTLAPFDAASSGPVYDMVAGEQEALSSQYAAVQYEESYDENDSFKPEDEIIRAQYDNLMSQFQTQITHEETRSADIKSRAESETSETREPSPQLTETSPQLSETREPSPQLTETREPSPQLTETREPSPQLAETRDPSPQLAETREPFIQLTETREPFIQLTEIREPSPETREPSPQLSETREPSPQLTGSAASRNYTEEVSETPKSKGDEALVDYSIITGNRDDEVNTVLWKKWQAVKAVQMPYSTRKENLSNGDGESCDGRYIYVYDLPSEFNTDLAARCDTLFPWLSLCDFFVDSGRGTPVNALENGTQIFVPGDRWFNTHQYALEMVSHARILKYKCRTDDPKAASLFYIPYYGGLDVIRWHFQGNATNDKRDELALKLFRWLEQQASWRNQGGRDHVLVLGKISWDFRRQMDGMWGSRLLEFTELQQVTKVMIERDPWAVNDIGVPHPTYFHPQSTSDIDTWLRHVRSQSRTSLVTFVGKERKNDPTNVRTALVQQCRNATSESECRFVECDKDNCLKPAYVTKAFMATHFCMQPVGDSPTRRSVFDSLIAGCIPVLFHSCTAYVQYPWHLPANESTWSVYISEDAIRAGTASVVDTLKQISVAQRDAMRENIINNVIPGLLYSAPGSDISPYRDAFDITIDQLLYRVKHRPPLDKSDFLPVQAR